MKNEPQIQELEARQVLCASFVGDYMANSQIFDDLFTKLCRWAGPKGLMSTETVFMSSYQDDPLVTPPEELTLDFCMTISQDVAEVGGGLTKKTLPGGKFAVGQFEIKGPEEYGDAWMSVIEWMGKNGLEMDMSLPSYEIYLKNPEEHPEKLHLIEICVRVKT